MKSEIATKLSRSFYKVGFQLKKHSPEILVGAGIVGTVASAVLACRATTKISLILDEAKDTIDAIHETVEKAEKARDPEIDNVLLEKEEETALIDYTAQDAQKDLAIVYVQTGIKFAKLYAPAVVFGALSITSILAGTNILHKRNVALAAAYATIERSFKQYRDRVVDRFGAELDRELKYNIRSEKVEEVVKDENGKEKKITKNVDVIDPNNINDYSRIFYEGNVGWDKSPQYTLMFLKQQQNWANDLLKRRGYLFLNEVYDMLGFARIPDGQLMGWIYDEKNPVGDNFVDFGLYDIHDENKIRFVNGDEKAIILEFNHDGYILDKM